MILSKYCECANCGEKTDVLKRVCCSNFLYCPCDYKAENDNQFCSEECKDEFLNKL